MKRLIILTTPTSATSSLWRTTRYFVPPEWKTGWFIDDCLAQGMTFDQIAKAPLPDEGCFLFNQPHLFNFEQDFEETKFILNFRDPRDLCCNQFHWVFSHPRPNMTPEDHQAWQERVRAEGIDQFALRADNRPLFKSHIAVAKNPALLQKTTAVSYVQLCFDVYGTIDRIASLFEHGKTPEEVAAIKKKEHPSNLTGTNQWIGGKWGGADVFPGRARVELQQSTFDTLTEKYGEILTLLRTLDLPEFAYFYS